MSAKDDGKRQPRRRKKTVVDSQPANRLPNVVDFIELVPFTRRWAKLGLDEESDLLALQLLVMSAPDAAPVIRGTAGLRKLRFSPPRWHTGKSGSTRVLYVCFERLRVVLLCLVYGKNEIDDISDRVKATLNERIAETERELRRLCTRK